MRVLRFLRSRFVRVESRGEWWILIATGVFTLAAALFAFYFSYAGRTPDEPVTLWSKIFPPFILTVGALNLLKAWRTRHQTFEQ